MIFNLLSDQLWGLPKLFATREIAKDSFTSPVLSLKSSRGDNLCIERYDMYSCSKCVNASSIGKLRV